MCTEQGHGGRQLRGVIGVTAHPAGCWCLLFFVSWLGEKGMQGAYPKSQSPQPFFGRKLEEWEMSPSLALMPWGAGAGQGARLTPWEGRCCATVPWGSQAGTQRSGTASTSLLHNTAYKHTQDTEQCPKYSVHVFWGLA